MEPGSASIYKNNSIVTAEREVEAEAEAMRLFFLHFIPNMCQLTKITKMLYLRSHAHAKNKNKNYPDDGMVHR